MKLIVGIGNPGPKYDSTRHNVGFDIVDRLAARGGVRFTTGRCQALEATIDEPGQRLLLAKPMTYVNLSGNAVGSLLTWYDIGLDDLLVVVDCVSLELGRLRLRRSGSSAGHNGTQSIIDAVGTDRFARLRVGVGPSAGSAALTRHVLGRFSKEERPVADEAMQRAAEAALAWSADDIDEVMSRFN